MSQLRSGQRIVAEGTFLYDGLVECDIRIVFGPICFGCGEFDEEAHLYGDVVRDTYYVDFGSTTARGVFNASGGAYSSLEEAMTHTLMLPGIGSSVKWIRFLPEQDTPAVSTATS